MERFELEPALQDEIRTKVFSPAFMKLVQVVRRGGGTFKISLRRVKIGGIEKFQAEMVEDGQVQVKNLDESAAREGLEEIIAQRGARDLHLMTGEGDLHIRVTKKGHVMPTRSAKMDRPVEVQAHDRVKNLPLTEFDATALLRAIGIADGEGRVRASMRGKYDQVNEFLKHVKDVLSTNPEPRTPNHVFTVVDCGCGKAYLTFSIYFYLTQALGLPDVRVIGIDRREDVLEAARRAARQLDVADKVTFLCADLHSLVDPAAPKDSTDPNDPRSPAFACNMVISLHACDTATDEALARAVEWKAQYVLSAPCCQHELNAHMAKERNDDFSGLLRQSILRERLCDLLTDGYRAMIMRILGFKTQVVEFVSSEATQRNILLKCEYGVKSNQSGPISEYLALRDYWHVTPWLETRLKNRLDFSRYI